MAPASAGGPGALCAPCPRTQRASQGPARSAARCAGSDARQCGRLLGHERGRGLSDVKGAGGARALKDASPRRGVQAGHGGTAAGKPGRLLRGSALGLATVGALPPRRLPTCTGAQQAAVLQRHAGASPRSHSCQGPPANHCVAGAARAGVSVRPLPGILPGCRCVQHEEEASGGCLCPPQVRGGRSASAGCCPAARMRSG